jgi:hypothetical protein
VAEGISTLNLREKRTILNQISKPCKGKPNSHAWNIQWSFRSNHLPFIPTRGTGPPQVTVGPYAYPMCRTYVCNTTTWPYSYPLCGTNSRTSVREKNQIMSGGRHVHSLGQLVNRLTAFHISRHVASTFKRLVTTTTHCDLINFYQHRQGNHSCHDTARDPVHRPYSDCRIVITQFLYRAKVTGNHPTSAGPISRASIRYGLRHNT